MEEKFYFDFNLQDFTLKINYSCSKNIGRCKITLLDALYKCILYSYEIELLENENHFFYSPTCCILASSKFLILKIENQKNEIIFSKDFKISQNIDLILLDCFPDIVKYKNQNLYLPIVVQIFLFNIYEKFNLLIKKDDVVVDIGANFGIFSYFAFYKNPSKLYICEPNPNLFNVLENHFFNYKNIYLDNCAISKTNGYLDFAMVNAQLNNLDGQRNHLNFHSEMIEMFKPSEDLPPKIIKVKTKSFMEFVLSNQIHKIDFLKVDCEGGEYDIFIEENASYIRNNVDKIVVEYHNCANQIVDFANKNNFIILNEIQDTNCDVLFLKNKNEPRK
jgi:FkbM family methyltransferase